MLITSTAYTFGGLAWGGATVMAVLAVRAGEMDRHVRWIIRSYAYLLMVVTARIIIISLNFTGLSDREFYSWPVAYAITIVATFAINLILAERIVSVVCPVKRITAAYSASLAWSGSLKT